MASNLESYVMAGLGSAIYALGAALVDDRAKPGDDSILCSTCLQAPATGRR
jgi:hypothetical protein